MVFGNDHPHVLWFSFLCRDGVSENLQGFVVDCTLVSAVTTVHVFTPVDRSLSVRTWDLMRWVLDQMETKHFRIALETASLE